MVNAVSDLAEARRLNAQNEDATELHQALDKRYDADWREKLAEAATRTAIAEDQSQSVEEIAQAAARIALGLKPLDIQQGEQ